MTARTMNGQRQRNAYLVLLDAADHVLAQSAGFTAQARAEVPASEVLALVHSGHPYGLGNLVPYGRTGAIDFAVVFQTAYGRRTLVTGFTPVALSSFIAGELGKIPGVKGAHNYLIDGYDTVLASTNPAIPPGSRLNKPAQLRAL